MNCSRCGKQMTKSEIAADQWRCDCGLRSNGIGMRYTVEELRDQFKAATQNMDYDRAVVLGSIVGQLTHEVERLRTETIGVALYELERLERNLDLPERGYVRNCFNSVVRTLEEGLEGGKE